MENKTGKAVTAFFVKLIVSMIFAAVFALVEGWLLKVTVEAIHDYWIDTLPTVTYWPAVLVMFLAGCLVSVWRSGTSASQAISDS